MGNSAANYFAGLALALFETAKKEEINLNSIVNMNATGYENFAISNYISEYFKFFDKTHVAFTQDAVIAYVEPASCVE